MTRGKAWQGEARRRAGQFSEKVQLYRPCWLRQQRLNEILHLSGPARPL